MSKGLTVIIDMSFWDLLQEKEKKSMKKQLEYCHAYNRLAIDPVKMKITNCSESSQIYIDKS